MAMKWNYTDEQRKAVKNLDVSCNILKQDIKALEVDKEGKSEAEVAAIQAKIDYKVERIAEKQAKKAEIQEAAGQVERTFTKKVVETPAEQPAVEASAE